MNSRLDLELIMEDHELRVVDPYDYKTEWSESEDKCKHLVIRCLLKKSTLYENEYILLDTYELDPDTFDPRYDKKFKYEVSNDGSYYYREILVPIEGHAEDQEVCYKSIGDEFKLIIGGSDKDITYDSFEEAYNIIVNEGTLNCFWYDGDTFTLSDLITCFIKLEQQVLDDFTCKCKESCDTNKDLDAKLTILSAAINTIDYLLESDEIEDAQEILERITTCSGFCNDKPNKTCCGRAI